VAALLPPTSCAGGMLLFSPSYEFASRTIQEDLYAVCRSLYHANALKKYTRAVPPKVYPLLELQRPFPIPGEPGVDFVRGTTTLCGAGRLVQSHAFLQGP